MPPAWARAASAQRHHDNMIAKGDMMMEERKKFSVRLLPDDHARLAQYAREHDWSYNKAISHMIRQLTGKAGEKSGDMGHFPGKCQSCVDSC